MDAITAVILLVILGIIYWFIPSGILVIAAVIVAIAFVVGLFRGAAFERPPWMR